MKYIAKPRLANSIDQKEFDTAKEAVMYLNEMLSDVNVDPKFDYVYSTPSVSPKNLKYAIEDYINIGKLIVKEA
jgi:hypothetical protein